MSGNCRPKAIDKSLCPTYVFAHEFGTGNELAYDGCYRTGKYGRT